MDGVKDTKDEIPSIETALPAMMPTLRQANRQGWAMVAGLILAAGGLFYAAIVTEGDIRQWSFIGGGLCLFLISAAARWVRKRHEAQIMPLLARTAGLSYQQNGKAFLADLPDRLLPKASRNSCEDLLAGHIGDRAIRFGEVKIETGGKNSTTLFKGIVMAFPNVVDMPAFFIASERQTRGWFIFKGNISVEGLVRVQGHAGPSGIEYGVWASSEAAAQAPGFGAAVQVLTGLESLVGEQAKLYTATSNGREIHLAISHTRDLFKIGGLLASQEALMDQIRHAYDDLTLPMRIVSALLQAESQVAGAAKGSSA